MKPPDLLFELAKFFFDAAIGSLDSLRRGFSADYPTSEDPPSLTKYEAVHCQEKTSLRLYKTPAERGPTPNVLVYAPIKRPFILDSMPGKA